MLIELSGKKLGSGKDTFRTIRFAKNRLNIVLAEKSKESGNTRSRNGLGKTTFVQIIDFCMGAAVSDSGLPCEDLADWTFTLEFSIGALHYRVTRGTNDPEKFYVVGDIPLECPIRPSDEASSLDGIVVFKEDKWRKFLSWAYFKLQPNDIKNGVVPEYRNLIGHFVRQYFDDPIRSSQSEAISRAELATTYLLGLDWQYFIDMRELRRKDERLACLQGAAEYEMQQWAKEQSLLEQDCQRIEQKIAARMAELDRFKTVPQFVDNNESVAELTRQIHNLENRMTRNRRKLNAIDEVKNTPYVDFRPLIKMYEMAGKIFSGGAQRQIEDVKRFHERITENRAILLDDQRQKIMDSLDDDHRLLEKLDKSRSEAIAATRSNDVFAEYTAYQRQLTELSNELALKRSCIERIETARKERNKVAERRQRRTDLAEKTHESLRSTWGAEERFFRDFIKRLYGIEDGTLGIEITMDPKRYGITYNPHFNTDRSMGKKKLKALAMDLTIFNRQPQNHFPIDFMVHDSVLYESTDSRQYAQALLLADELCGRQGLQYICVMNSDDVQNSDFEEIFPFEELNAKYVIHRLSDKDVSMTLLGEAF